MKKTRKKRRLRKSLQNLTFYGTLKFLLTLVYLLVFGYFIYYLIIFNIIPLKLLIPIVVLLSVISLIVLSILWTKGKKVISKVLIVLMVILMGAGYSYGYYSLYRIHETLMKVTSHEGMVKNRVSLIVMKDSGIEKPKELEGEKVSFIEQIDKKGSQEMKVDLRQKNINYNGSSKGTIHDLVASLYDGSSKAIVLNEQYRTSVEDLQDMKNFSKDTKVIYTCTYYTESKVSKNKDEVSITETPFTVLISGSDSRGSVDEIARSDVNMLVTVNPKTGTVLMTGIPRDYYVPFDYKDNSGMVSGQKDKLTHSGMHGVDTTECTIENLLGVTINYNARVNFSSVINLVDALGGIDVYVEPGYAVPQLRGNKEYGVVEGWNHMNGEHALAFSRERYAYTEGDRQRVKNQQTVLKAIIEKVLSPSILTSWDSLLKAMEGTFHTNLGTDDISALVQQQLVMGTSWKIVSYSLDGSTTSMYSPELGANASVMIPDEDTVKLASAKINAVLGGEDPDAITLETLTESTENTEAEADGYVEERPEVVSQYQNTLPEQAYSVEISD